MAIGAWRAGAWRTGAWRPGAWRGMDGAAPPALVIDPRYLAIGRAASLRLGPGRTQGTEHTPGTELTARLRIQNASGIGREWTAAATDQARTAEGASAPRSAPYGPDRLARYDADRDAQAPERNEGG